MRNTIPTVVVPPQPPTQRQDELDAGPSAASLMQTSFALTSTQQSIASGGVLLDDQLLETWRSNATTVQSQP